MSIAKLSTATAGAVFIALGTCSTAPATAALVEFNFTTENGGTGTFTLNTDTAPNPETVIFRPGLTGITFPNAVSDFSFSAPYITLSSDTTGRESMLAKAWGLVP